MKKKIIEDKKDYLKLLPIALILLSVPLIVFMKIIPLEGIMKESWTGVQEYTDFFSYYKSLWIIILSASAFAIYLYYYYQKRFNFDRAFIYVPLVVYSVFVLLSTLFSEYKDVTLWGFVDRYEGFFVILSYILLCFITSVLVTNLFDVKLLYSCLFICVLIISILGVTQFFGFDFFQTNLGKHIILPAEHHNMINSLNFNFPKNYIYGTLYNPNYVGSFFAMVFPISIVLFIFTKNRIYKIGLGVLSLLSYINVLGCLSNAGYIGVAITVVVILVISRKQLLKNLAPLLLLVILFIASGIIMNSASDGAIARELNLPSSKNASSTQMSNATNDTTNGTVTTYNVTDLDINGSKFTLYVEGKPLYIYFNKDEKAFYFKDADDNFVNVVKDPNNEKSFSFDNVNFSGITMTIENSALRIKASNTEFFTTIMDDKFYIYNQLGVPTEIIRAESFGFEGYEKLGSSRGYIWSRSIPMIKDTLVLGHGPDTFAIYFPQNDYSAKLNFLSTIFTVVDKPHNMFLQIAINTGVLSLLAFLCFIGIYLITSIKLYFKPKYYNGFYIPGVCSLVAIFGFLIAGLFNDSTVSVSPIFWILLGLGIACNRNFKKVNSQQN